jgi:tetratricopeptide (TPR) repeat protein
VARFDPGIPAAAAVFRRGGAVWVVFAAPGPFDVGRLLAQGRGAFRTGAAIPAEGGFAFRFPLPREAWPSVGRDGTVWTVRLEPEPVPLPRPLAVEAQRDFPMGARLFVPAEAADGVVTLTDPAVGDTLAVVPLRTAGAGIADRHAYPQVRLPPSAQGAVVVPLSEAVVVRLVEGGIEITAASGLWLSSGADAAAARRTTDPEAVDRLFDLAEWQGPPGRFEAQRRELQRRIVHGPEDDREQARLDQARFYFSHGYAAETLGLLDIVAANRPAVLELPEFRALRGAARVLAGRPEAAAEDLSVPALADSEEAALWRAAAAAETGDREAAAAGFRRAGSLRYAYPPPLQRRFLLWAAETWLHRDDPEAAERELDWLADATDGASERLPAVNYLRGEIARGRGNVQIAERYLRRAAESNDRLYYRLAGAALIDLERAQGRLSPEEEVERLESMRFAWRGDGLEFDLLRRLGDAYWRAGDYREAIETWQEGIGLYPDLPAAQALADTLPGRLTDLLQGGGGAGAGEGGGDAVPPVTALSLYREHGDLLPDGAVRDRLAVHLAERLAEVDLLDQAGDLLSGALDGGAGEDAAPGDGLDAGERARIGTRLAAIRLLDDQPEAALGALDRSQAAAADDADLHEERRLLRARALSELDDPEAALVLLEPSEGALADAARLDIAWRARDWPLAASVLEGMVGEPPALGEPVPEAQAQLVLNQGIALAMARDAEGLDRLAARFGPSMAESPHANVFALLTRSSTGSAPLEGLAAVRRQVAEVDLFEEFLSGYRNTGAGNALTN